MRDRRGTGRGFRHGRQAAALLALFAVACQLLLPLVATAGLAGPGSPTTVTICSALGVRTVPADAGLPADGDERGHVADSLDCLLCCARLAVAVVPAAPAPPLVPDIRPLRREGLADLRIGRSRIASKGPRAPPVV